jgi:uncharacterized YigZ family protein
MEKEHLRPAREARAEIRIENSRFIATLAPASSVEEARVFIARIKAEFADAAHNVPAFVVGSGSSVITHSSDDGEPSGTAGRPALIALSGSGLGDAAVVVTRYFGGIKLGTGGLVRAYTEAVQAVLAVTPRARLVATHTVMLALPYSLFERVRRLVGEHEGEILDEEFGADVTLTLRFPVQSLPPFQEALQELSAGSLRGEIIESENVLIEVEPRSS